MKIKIDAEVTLKLSITQTIAITKMLGKHSGNHLKKIGLTEDEIDSVNGIYATISVFLKKFSDHK